MGRLPSHGENEVVILSEGLLGETFLTFLRERRERVIFERVNELPNNGDSLFWQCEWKFLLETLRRTKRILRQKQDLIRMYNSRRQLNNKDN